MALTHEQAFAVVRWAENVAKENDANVLSVVREFDCSYKNTGDVDKAKNIVEKYIGGKEYEEVCKES